MGLSLSLRWPQNPVRRVCHRSDWLPAHCLLICLSFPGQSHSGLEPLQHKQAHWFAHTKGPRSTVTGLSFRFPSSAFRHLPPPPFPASPSGRKDLGHMPGAGRQSASHLEEMLHFSPLTQKKKIWFSESLFLALRVPKGRNVRRRGLQPLTVA